jgi:hypothetical protein
LGNLPTPLPVYGAQDRIKLALFNVTALLIEATRSAGNLSVETLQHQNQARVIFHCDSALVAAERIAVLPIVTHGCGGRDGAVCCPSDHRVL